MVHCLKDDPSSAKFYPPGVDVVLHILAQKNVIGYKSANGYYMTSETVPAKAIEKSLGSGVIRCGVCRGGPAT